MIAIFFFVFLQGIHTHLCSLCLFQNWSQSDHL